MQPLVEPGSFVWGFVSGAAFTFVGVMTWALCASAKMGDETRCLAEFRGVRCDLNRGHPGDHMADYELSEYIGRDLPPAA